MRAVKKGIVNLEAHIKNMQQYGVPVVVAINRFGTDSEAELGVISDCCEQLGCDFALSDVFANGGDGGIELAEKVVEACEKPGEFKLLYDEKEPIKEKIKTIAQKIYHADDVVYTGAAEKAIRDITALGFDKLPVCIAKTQYSLSDNPKLLGAPSGFEITVRDVRLSAGAGFLVVLTGEIMTMPGLPKHPAALDMDVNSDGTITGLS